jgi:hypothetical protein
LNQEPPEGVSFGRLQFDRASDRRLEGSPWYIRVPEKYASEGRVGEVYDFLINNHQTFDLQLPSLVLSVTGDAGATKNLRPQYMDTLKAGLVTAVKSTDAWIFDGGMEAGVMKLMGDIRAGNFFISFASNAFYF